MRTSFMRYPEGKAKALTFSYDDGTSYDKRLAEVFDKYKSNIVSRYPKIFKQESYIIVFKTKDKKLSFNVSAYSYNNYRIKEKGTLKYKGNQIISFK